MCNIEALNLMIRIGLINIVRNPQNSIDNCKPLYYGPELLRQERLGRCFVLEGVMACLSGFAI